MSGLQTGVCSQPEDRCASVCVWPGPEPVCMCPSYALDSVRLFPVVGVVSDGVAGRGSCGPGFVREARESVGVSRSGHGLLAHGAPWLRPLGLCGRLGWSSNPAFSVLELPGRLLLAGVGWVGAASRQAMRPG